MNNRRNHFSNLPDYILREIGKKVNNANKYSLSLTSKSGRNAVNGLRRTYPQTYTYAFEGRMLFTEHANMYVPNQKNYFNPTFINDGANQAHVVIKPTRVQLADVREYFNDVSDLQDYDNGPDAERLAHLGTIPDAVDFDLMVTSRDTYKVIVTFAHKKTRAFLEELAATGFVETYVFQHPNGAVCTFISNSTNNWIELHFSVPRFVAGEGTPAMNMNPYNHGTNNGMYAFSP